MAGGGKKTKIFVNSTQGMKEGGHSSFRSANSTSLDSVMSNFF